MNLTNTEIPVSLLNKQTDWIANYQPRLGVIEQGTVVSIGDGISWISGLPSAAIEDILIFEVNNNANTAIIFLSSDKYYHDTLAFSLTE